MKNVEKELERFARYIWGLSPHNFYDRNYKGIVDENVPLDKYKVMEYIKELAKKLDQKKEIRDWAESRRWEAKMKSAEEVASIHNEVLDDLIKFLVSL